MIGRLAAPAQPAMPITGRSPFIKPIPSVERAAPGASEGYCRDHSHPNFQTFRSSTSRPAANPLAWWVDTGICIHAGGFRACGRRSNGEQAAGNAHGAAAVTSRRGNHDRHRNALVSPPRPSSQCTTGIDPQPARTAVRSWRSGGTAGAELACRPRTVRPEPHVRRPNCL